MLQILFPGYRSPCFSRIFSVFELPCDWCRQVEFVQVNCTSEKIEPSLRSGTLAKPLLHGGVQGLGQ